ncbi:TetR/AcrR family transcriptional regulator [Dyella solisilvae]|uniref:TetR/AcrR family transcriptional regulator n=1 Tax=Dyella solisilvae TaxID=1920168 RepID=A0A370KBV1_9GAMM|nr:TetR/AcrR family transcriptional regulator [Dyella solisilvae]RDJ00134.1 TetR/AcrR family transcriptional regulator [Dyella solisilvae]
MAPSAPPRTRRSKPVPPELTPKLRPAQSRATETYEQLLEVTAQILTEVGFERLSTNMVCERAGLSPPALYRYFPNKYALLHELGRRLMEQQNALIAQWLTPEVFTGDTRTLERALTGLLLETYRITQQADGGMWILRALRAVPALQDVRLASAREVSNQATLRLSRVFPQIDPAQLELISRVADGMAFAALEMLFDDPSLDPTAVMGIVAATLASYFERLRATPAA